MWRAFDARDGSFIFDVVPMRALLAQSCGAHSRKNKMCGARTIYRNREHVEARTPGLGFALMATLDEVTERIRRAAASGVVAEASIKIDLKGDGFVHIAHGEVTNNDAPADLVVTIAMKDLTALAKGELDATRAIMTGRMRLSDFALAMKLQPQIQSLFSKAA